jgi:transposase-like protein
MIECPHCHSTRVKKNGHTYYDKQNYQCTTCLRQFVESGQDWFVSQADKDLIDKLLLERISLAGICRVCNVGQSWLQRYIKDKYESCPDDLNADLVLPNMDSYLSDRMDEEINRIQVQKKSQ